MNICLLCLPYKSLCADQQYEVCKKARYCGNQSIQFPFYIKETTGYCGYPGFKLNCINNNVLLLNISEARYKVHEIFYQNNSLSVCNALSLNSSFCNLAKIRNSSLPSDGRLELQNSSVLILLSNCSLKSDQIFFKYKVACDLKKNDADWVLAMKVKDPNISYATEVCKNVAMAPVHDYEEDDNTDYIKMIRNGFDLRWMASNCSNCKASGGICGYNGEPVNTFQCFCKDRPRSGGCLSKSL